MKKAVIACLGCGEKLEPAGKKVILIGDGGRKIPACHVCAFHRKNRLKK